MIEGMSIICISQDWQGDPTSKTHIMRVLAKKNRVLWVNSIGMRRPTASRADLKRMITKLRRSLAGCKEVEPTLFFLDPLVFLLLVFGLEAWWKARFFAQRFRAFCGRTGSDNRLLW